MKKLAMGALLMAGAVTAFAEVGVAVSVGQPGFYGQIVLGNPYPAPQVIYPQPVIIQPPPVAVVQAPMYLRVPPGQMKKWGRYCGNYGACGRQVYFVQDTWYQNVYAPRYNSYAGRPGPGGRYDDHDHHHDDRGRGNGHGRGHGHGHGHD
ncbi:hypothetical protein [Methylophilus sp. 5]|uniref:hypothetical protein n=1 Tax=Methylophilus sp. 5 TaxID=1112274 RepID=UPI00048C1AC0